MPAPVLGPVCRCRRPSCSAPSRASARPAVPAGCTRTSGSTCPSWRRGGVPATGRGRRRAAGAADQAGRGRHQLRALAGRLHRCRSRACRWTPPAGPPTSPSRSVRRAGEPAAQRCDGPRAGRRDRLGRCSGRRTSSAGVGPPSPGDQSGPPPRLVEEMSTLFDDTFPLPSGSPPAAPERAERQPRDGRPARRAQPAAAGRGGARGQPAADRRRRRVGQDAGAHPPDRLPARRAQASTRARCWPSRSPTRPPAR